MFFWRAALGRAVWRAAFVHVGSAYWRYMIRGVFGIVKGGFSRIRRRMQDGGDSRLRGNDGVGAGMTGGVEMVGRGDENGGTQRRRGAMKSRGVKGYGTVSDAMGCSASEKMFLR